LPPHLCNRNAPDTLMLNNSPTMRWISKNMSK
jgi:hypothetical protein